MQGVIPSAKRQSKAFYIVAEQRGLAPMPIVRSESPLTMNMIYSEEGDARAKVHDIIVTLRAVFDVVFTVPTPNTLECERVVHLLLQELRGMLSIWAESPSNLEASLDAVASLLEDRIRYAENSSLPLRCRVCAAPLKPIRYFTWEQSPLVNKYGWELSGTYYSCGNCGKVVNNTLRPLEIGFGIARGP